MWAAGGGGGGEGRETRGKHWEETGEKVAKHSIIRTTLTRTITIYRIMI